MASKPLVPQLRFPEFRQAREWHVRNVGDLFAERQETGFTDLPLLSVTDKEGVIPQEQTNRRDNSNIDRSKYLRVVPGDIVYNTMRMWEGRSALVGLEGVVSPAYTVCKPKAESNSRFFSFYFKTPQLIENFRKLSQGLVKDTLNLKYEAFSNIFVLVPSPAEQQKISECLASLDELIVVEGRKLEALRAHKKGLMQNLFPREGEKIPRIRFPEFRNAGAWEEVALGDVADIRLGKMLDGKKHTTGHLLPYLNNISLRWNEVDTSNLPQMYFEEEELDRYGLKAGDVVVCEGGEPGRAAVWDGRLPELKYQKAVHRVRLPAHFEPHFLVAYLEAIAGTNTFEALFTGGGIKHLTRETFERLKIPAINADEQRSIASILFALDALITIQAKKLDTLKLHKQGLMQGLFPSSEEAEA